MRGIHILIAVLLYVSAASGGNFSVFEKSIMETGFDKRKHLLRGGPHLFIIGAQKCATTSLHHLLLGHPSICPSVTKEIHYFDRSNNWANGASYYLAHFKTSNANCRADKMGKDGKFDNTSHRLHFLDATPDYFTNALVPARLSLSYPPKDLARKRFILILREPVAREFSWYNHRMRLCSKSMHEYMKRRSKVATGPLDPSKVCADKHCAPLNCKDRAEQAVPILGKEVNSLANFTEYYRTGGLMTSKGLYMTHLQRWLEFFPREQFFIVNLATLLHNTTDTVQRLTRFLGIPEFPVDPAAGGKIVLPHENSARVDTSFDCEVRNELYPFYEKENRALMKYLSSSGRLDTGDNSSEPPFPEFETQPCVSGQIS